jgi:hypothetical protein
MTIENHDFEEDQTEPPIVPRGLTIAFIVIAALIVIIACIADY